MIVTLDRDGESFEVIARIVPAERGHRDRYGAQEQPDFEPEVSIDPCGNALTEEEIETIHQKLNQ